MNSKVIEILKNRDFTVPKYLITNYKKLNINGDLVILLIYLINMKEPIVCDYNKFSNDLNTNLETIMNEINTLVDLKLIEIEVKKNKELKLEEYINLDLLYNKMFLQVIDIKEEKEDVNNIYSIFEKELKRTLAPLEYELINGWLESNYKKEIIIAALKEAVINGVNNLRYIDRILIEWDKKGIDTLEKVEKSNKKFKKNSKVEIPEYDWLNNE